MILTDSEETLSEEQFVALEALHRSEGSAWLGRDLRQTGTGAGLESNLPAMSRARVWTDSSTVAAQNSARSICWTLQVVRDSKTICSEGARHGR